MSVLFLLVGLAGAQDSTYAFPTSDDHYGFFYPTAYLDEGGVTDWNCGSITYGGHRGSDFGGGGFPGMDAGRDILAGGAGTVVYVNDGEFDRCTTGECAGGSGFGNYVKIEDAAGYTTYYAHMKTWSVAVAVGDRVSCGDHLGQMGSSGFSTGPHLHFEVRDPAGTSKDPFEGPCSSNPSTYWLDQGLYDALPGNTCDGGGPDPDPDPVEVTISVSPLIVGRIGTLRVEGAEPGEEVVVLRSGAAGDWCPVVMGGDCTGLAHPGREWARGPADGDGVASFPRLVSRDSTVGNDHFLQAFVYRGGHWRGTEVARAVIE
ncbi:MAG: murein DD-endopeptidase MepM/ murein hydrolase activator NlpD [Myxococcota bacterium]|jgi:murein DD-endopeptidase MepM/ murein hydrolase activator NlpD